MGTPTALTAELLRHSGGGGGSARSSHGGGGGGSPHASSHHYHHRTSTRGGGERPQKAGTSWWMAGLLCFNLSILLLTLTVRDYAQLWSSTNGGSRPAGGRAHLFGTAAADDTARAAEAIAGTAPFQALMRTPLAQRFTVYVGHEGDCGAGLIAELPPSLAVTQVLQLCLGNANCTFFAYHPARGARVCSGRIGSGAAGMIVTDADDARAPGWVSGDRRGCERYSVHQAAVARATGGLPVCHTELSTDGCPFYSLSGANCITKLLNYRQAGFVLSDTQSTRQLCEYDNQVVLWKASDSPSQAQCQWRPSAALGAADYKNMRSGRHLFSELTKYQAGAVHLSDHCLCDNPREGLVIGPYCANEDCHWDPAPAECVFRSRLSQRCMSDLLVSMAPASKCLCEERGGLAIAYGPACAASTCQWHWNAGAFLNQASSRALAAHVAQQMDGSLLARERHCFCDVGGKLEFSSACDSANCQWTRGSREEAELLNPTAPHFDITQRSKLQCVTVLLPVQKASSLTEALQLCINEPQCTAVAHNRLSGFTLVCRGHYKDPDTVSADGGQWVSAVRKGCRSESEQSVLESLADYSGAGELCYDAVGCGACPLGSARTQACDADGRGVCDTFLHGFAGIFPGARAIAGFEAALQDVAASLPDPNYRSFNPSAFTHAGRAYVVYRMANNTLCTADAFGDQGGQRYISRLGLCGLDAGTGMPSQCRELAFDVAALVPAGAFVKEHPVFMGLEDPRGFSLGGAAYVTATINLVHANSHETGYVQQKIVLARLDRATMSKLENIVVLRQPYLPQILTQKNWAALVLGERLVMAARVQPLHLLAPDGRTGECELVAAQRLTAPQRLRLERATGGEPLRGGSPFIDTPLGPLAIVHRKKDYAQGPIYTHHFVLLGVDGHLPAGGAGVNVNVSSATLDPTRLGVAWTSPGFRLPELPGMPAYAGVQFATGLVLQQPSGQLLVSYGLGDCHAALAALPNFLAWLRAAVAAEASARGSGGGDGAESGSSGSTINDAAGEIAGRLPGSFPEPVLANSRPTVRWEAIASDWSSLSIVTREMSTRIMKFAPHLGFEIADQAQGVAPRVRAQVLSGAAGAAVDRVVIKSNLKANAHPSVVVRMHWPPNFHKPLAQHWVQYLPWEFEAIPDDWVAALNANASEVWAPSTYVMHGFIKSGVKPSKVHVVPHGVDASLCTPLPENGGGGGGGGASAGAGGAGRKMEPGGGGGNNKEAGGEGGNVSAEGADKGSSDSSVAAPGSSSASAAAASDLPFLTSTKRFRFLYKGGALWRKGLDALLAAYYASFTASDDVSLIIHITYGDPGVFQMLNLKLQATASNASAPHVLVLGMPLTAEQNKRLYEAADAYVHPARAEGYGMTIVEAMALARPVIVPSLGGHTDFVSEATAFIVPAKMAVCARSPCRLDGDGGDGGGWVFDYRLSQPPRWAEVDVAAFAAAMKRAVDEPDERARRGAAARAHVCGSVTWDNAAKIAAARLEHLARRSVGGVGGAGGGASAAGTGAAATTAAAAAVEGVV